MFFRRLITDHCLLITDHRSLITAFCFPLSFLTSALLSASFLLSSCAPQTPQPTTLHASRSTLYIYRFDPPAFIEYSADFQPINEIPFSIPPSCGLFNTFPAPIGKYLLIELNCPNGQTVLFFNTDSGSTTQPITDSDAHFLAWISDGKAAYLKIDSLGSPQIIRAYIDGIYHPEAERSGRNVLPINEYTYDISANPTNQDFTFTFSHGLGQGSELWLAQNDARNTQQLYSDPYNYISFARFSPDGEQIAFIKIPDTQTPFTVGELWVMDSDGSNARKLADADAGHGYAANWSPDGKRIAFVVRDNLEDETANLSSDALISNIFIVNVETNALKRITKILNGRAETPAWSPDGNTLAFNVVINDRMNVYLADVADAAVGMPEPTGSFDPVETRPLETESACCPAWMRK